MGRKPTFRFVDNRFQLAQTTVRMPACTTSVWLGDPSMTVGRCVCRFTGCRPFLSTLTVGLFPRAGCTWNRQACLGTLREFATTCLCSIGLICCYRSGLCLYRDIPVNRGTKEKSSRGHSFQLIDLCQNRSTVFWVILVHFPLTRK